MSALPMDCVHFIFSFLDFETLIPILKTPQVLTRIYNNRRIQMVDAAARGHLQTLKWIYIHIDQGHVFDVTRGGRTLFEFAATRNQVHVMDWMRQKRYSMVVSTHGFERMVKNECMDALRYLHACHMLHSRAISFAIDYGKADVLNLYDTSFFSDIYIIHALRIHQFEIVTYFLRRLRVQRKEKVRWVHGFIQEGNLASVEWLCGRLKPEPKLVREFKYTAGRWNWGQITAYLETTDFHPTCTYRTRKGIICGKNAPVGQVACGRHKHKV
jgi:hypothetical protein